MYNIRVFVVSDNFKLSTSARVCISWYNKTTLVVNSTYKIRNFAGYIFYYLQHFAIKLCNFTNFNMLLLAIIKDFVHIARIRVYNARKLSTSTYCFQCTVSAP